MNDTTSKHEAAVQQAVHGDDSGSVRQSVTSHLESARQAMQESQKLTSQVVSANSAQIQKAIADAQAKV